MRFFSLPFLFLLSALYLCGCSSHTNYVDPNSVDTVNADFGSTDLQLIAKKMVDGLLTFPPMVELTLKERPILFVDKIQNQTDEHINTQAIGNMVMTELLQSGKFRFVDMSTVQSVRQQLQYQQNSGLVNTATAVKVGKQLGAQYMLYGSLSNITKQNSDQKDVYFLMTMKLLNLHTGLVEWADQKQIRKVQTRATFGW